MADIDSMLLPKPAPSPGLLKGQPLPSLSRLPLHVHPALSSSADSGCTSALSVGARPCSQHPR